MWNNRNNKEWDSPRIKVSNHYLWPALFKWKTLLEEKNVTIVLGEYQPWLLAINFFLIGWNLVPLYFVRITFGAHHKKIKVVKLDLGLKIWTLNNYQVFRKPIKYQAWWITGQTLTNRATIESKMICKNTVGIHIQNIKTRNRWVKQLKVSIQARA